MTFNEYEKVLQEKRKALQPLKTEERKVVVDLDFVSMQLVEKKHEENFVKPVSSWRLLYSILFYFIFFFDT